MRGAQLKARTPDDVLSDTKYAAGSGYGESKYVIERVSLTRH